MYKNIYIKKFFTVVMLAMFALSNTPTKYLHKLFANHKDFVSKTLTNSQSPQLNTSGINCHCESNVVIAPYTISDAVSIAPLLPAFAIYFSVKDYQIYFSQPIPLGLRGPPSIA